MSFELIKFAWSGGELSPTFLGRTDLEKYDLGLALARNWFIDYRGGMSTRPGTVFLDYLMLDEFPIRLIPFKYAPNVANTYVLVFGHNYIRFVQDGAYVLEDSKTITDVTSANPGVVTAAAHGFIAGDWVKIHGVNGMVELNGRTFQVAAPTTDTFQLLDHLGDFVNTGLYTAYANGGAASRIYTLASPYASSELDALSHYQYRDLVRLTHASHPPRELVRLDAASWSLTTTTFGNQAGRPGSLTGTPSASGSVGGIFAVTSVNQEGEESLQSENHFLVNTVDYSSTAGNYRLSWGIVGDARYYNIYRSILINGGESDITQGSQLGYLGKAFGTSFVDNNIIPDFAKAPPLHNNPFAPSRVDYVQITGAGSGYDEQTTTVSISGAPGSGFVGFPVVVSGAVTNVVVLNGGSGYVGATATFSVGTGATAIVHLTPATGMYPALSTVFQQRQLYAASLNQPLTVWGSKPKQFNNFDVSDIITQNDSYEFDLDSEEVTPIRHLFPVTGGLLLFTDGGVWMMSGGGLNDPITPTNVLANPNTYIGIAPYIRPIAIDTDLIYIEGKGFTARLLEYNDFARKFAGTDISIFSNHFFGADNPITEWTFADDPFKLVWARRSDGALLSLTAVKEQKVFAWAQHWTKGFFERVLSIREGEVDQVYVIVYRIIAGREVRYLERFASRKFRSIEDAFCVDSGLSLSHTYPELTIFPALDDDDPQVIHFTTGVDFFAPNNVGRILRVSGGKARITEYVTARHVIGTVLREFTDVLPEDPAGYIPATASGGWTYDIPSTEIGGLYHLEGEIVHVNADGNVVKDLTVVNGTITLPQPASTVHVGIPYVCKAKTLPLTTQQGVIEAKRKRVVGILPRIHETRALKAGVSETGLYEVRERMNEIPGEPNAPVTGVVEVLPMSDWNNDGAIWFVQDSPMPASILNLVTDIEVGDDSD